MAYSLPLQSEGVMSEQDKAYLATILQQTRDKDALTEEETSEEEWPDVIGDASDLPM